MKALKCKVKGALWVAKKLFDKSIPASCGYCQNARLLSGGSEVFCMKKGLRSLNDTCRAYSYDPLKRVPKVKDIGRDYDPEDFKL